MHLVASVSPSLHKGHDAAYATESLRRSLRYGVLPWGWVEVLVDFC